MNCIDCNCSVTDCQSNHLKHLGDFELKMTTYIAWPITLARVGYYQLIFRAHL